EQLEFRDAKNERLGLPPSLRITLFSTTAGLLGGCGGMIHGYKLASLRYLASNSHRLPTSKSGWFFYHKRKNYYCLKESMITGFKTSLKLSIWVGLLFSLESSLDSIRGLKDFGNTMMATTLNGFIYAWINQMNKVQSKEYIKKGGRLGIVFGLTQDLYTYIRGGDLWYV
ncbi:hypothetical protein CANARDRAFT_191114, partial [[Candida] arabinofermentans NRRL YB-2248]